VAGTALLEKMYAQAQDFGYVSHESVRAFLDLSGMRIHDDDIASLQASLERALDGMKKIRDRNLPYTLEPVVTSVPAVKTALTIAGSDPSGGAGIQADLKTFSRLRVYGMSVITALTAQNTSGVNGIMEVPADFVVRQLDAVLADIHADAAKTGMLLTPGIVEVVAQMVRKYQIRNLVIDPVMVSTSGTPLLNREAIGTFSRILLPLALVITPNIDEARILTGKTITTVADMEEAALQVHGMGAPYVLIKGGHMAGDDVIDVLFDGANFSHFQSSRIHSRDTHGTGCVLSAAITAELAAGKGVREAVQAARAFVLEAIRHGLRLGTGGGPCDPLGL
jgi:hydroxymethylpyrimidine/phosphomethylpyrimidine kinase